MLLVAALAVLVVAAGACGDASTDDASDSAATPETSSTSEGAFPLSVEHALGTTEIETAPERIVALDMSLVDPVLALDLELVGYTTFSDPDGPLPDHFGEAIEEHASEAAWVGDLSTPNLEAIAVLDADLIVTAAVRHEALYDQLSAIAPTVMSDSAGGGWKDSLRLVAEATDRTEQAEALIGAYEQRAAEVGAAINGTAGDPTVSVVRFVDAIRLYQPTSFSGTVLADAGISRPESQQDPDDFITVVSEEELALADADVLLYTVYEHEDIESYVAGLRERPLWTSLGAVQRGDVHAVSDATWMSGVGIFGAHEILDDLADIFSTDPFPTDPEEHP